MPSIRVITPALVLSALVTAPLGAQQSLGQHERMVTVQGHAVRVHVQGLETRRPGAPVIVFEAGATNAIEVWSQVLPRAAELAPIVAYDRAGLGRSEWDGVRPTPRHVATRLRETLRQVGAEPPFLLVGFSWGGSLMRWFAGHHPTEIAGVVFVDPGPVVTMTMAETLAPYDSLGVGRAGYDAFWTGFGAFFSQAPPAVRAEFEVFRGIMEVAPAERELRPMPAVPAVMLVAGRFTPFPESLRLPFDAKAHFDIDLRHRMRVLHSWIAGSPDGTLVVAHNTRHVIPRDDPGLIVWAIDRVLRARR